MRNSISAFLVALLVLVGVCSCIQHAPPAKTTLRIGVLPIVDALPIHVAVTEGYFAEENLSVESVLFSSALERDSALLAGQIDIQLNDLVSTALLNRDADRVRIVRLAYRGNTTHPMMVLLVPGDSRAQSTPDLRGSTIGLSANTVIEYSADRLLMEAGVSPTEVQKTEVTKIPLRVEMLVRGQVDAAVLPEPMASLAVLQGARVIADDGRSGIGQSALSVRRELLESNHQAIKGFLTAYDRAVQRVNHSSDEYRDLFVEEARIPEPLRDSFKIPEYPAHEVPDVDDVAQVMDWMVRKGLLAQPLSYERMVEVVRVA